MTQSKNLDTFVPLPFLFGNSAIHKTKMEKIGWKQNHRKDKLIAS